MTKVAALYDIHGNLPALNAVLDEVEVEQPDVILIGGDMVAGPMPRQVLECLFAQGAGVRFIRGNADREVISAFDGEPLSASLPESVREQTSWVAAQLSQDQRDFLAGLPEQISFQVDGLGDVLFCHATPRTDEEIFTSLTPDDRLRVIFAGVQQQLVVCGHTHSQFERRLDDLRILNAGSVGMPYEAQPGAYWLLLTTDGPEHRRTAYDGQAAAQMILGSGYPHAAKFAESNVITVPKAEEATALFERMANDRWSARQNCRHST